MALLLLFLLANIGFSHFLAKRRYRVAAVTHLIFFLSIATVLLFSGFYPGTSQLLSKWIGSEHAEWLETVIRGNAHAFAPLSAAIVGIFLQTLTVLTEVTATSIIRIIRLGKKILSQTRKKAFRSLVVPHTSSTRHHAKLCYFLCVMRC